MDVNQLRVGMVVRASFIRTRLHSADKERLLKCSKELKKVEDDERYSRCQMGQYRGVIYYSLDQ